MTDLTAQIENELEYASKSKIMAYALWFGLFGCGVHRMYLSRVLSGIAQLGLFIAWIGAMIFATFYFAIIDPPAATSAEPPTGLWATAVVSVTLLGIWIIWAVVDAVLIPRWVSQDSVAKRAEIEARYRA